MSHADTALPGDVTANGPLAGQTLADLLKLYGHDLVGVKNDPALGFPLLVKFLDPSIRLHLQVHPSADFARCRLQAPSGKTEAYHILSIREEVRDPATRQHNRPRARSSAAGGSHSRRSHSPRA